MKEQLIKKETEQHVIVYVSADGLEFSKWGACSDYEERLFMVLKERIRRMAIKDTSSDKVFGGEGFEDHDAFVIVPKDDEQVETIRMLLSIYDKSPERECEKVQIGRPMVLLFSAEDSSAWVVDPGEMIRTATNGLFKVAPVE